MSYDICIIAGRSRPKLNSPPICYFKLLTSDSIHIASVVLNMVFTQQSHYTAPKNAGNRSNSIVAFSVITKAQIITICCDWTCAAA
jgi:hypothetical protein